MARVLYNNSTGKVIHNAFVGVHATGLVQTFNPPEYVEIDGTNNFNGVGSFRLYGSVSWKDAHTASGVFDWTEFDEAFSWIDAAGVTEVQWTNFNPPAWLANESLDYSAWPMCSLNSYPDYEEFIFALLGRYPKIRYVEVANEVFAPGIGDGFWVGDAASLALMSDWTLDAVQAYNAANAETIEVWAPSIPGFDLNQTAILDWLSTYPRADEFDVFPLHLYFLRAGNVGEPIGPSNSFTCMLEYRAGLDALGLSAPMVDGEKGFGFSTAESADPDAMAVEVYNYLCAQAALGYVRQVIGFEWTRIVFDVDASLGAPTVNAVVAGAWADAQTDLGGRHITNITDPEDGGRFLITYASASAGPDNRGAWRGVSRGTWRGVANR
jgi:hypothetical protein